MIYIFFYRWTDIELKRVIVMLRNPEFNAKNVDPDLHKRMQQAVDYGSIKSCIFFSDLPELHQKAVDLLNILQRYLPDKTGEKAKWNFKKAHSRPLDSAVGQFRQLFVPGPRGMY